MDSSSEVPKRRWLRYSLRTLLLLFTVVCLWLGWKVRDARQQEAAVKAALTVAPNHTQSPPRIIYAHQFTRQGLYDAKIKPIWPKWMLDLFGKASARDCRPIRLNI
jgi:hypothetical protein